MPYSFTPPTTSQLLLSAYLTSPTHPALPVSASSTRAVVRSALKQHHKLPLSQRPSHLSELHAALLSYLPYLYALVDGLKNGTNRSLVVRSTRDVEIQWTPFASTLSSSSSSSASTSSTSTSLPAVAKASGTKGRRILRRNKREHIRGLDAELGFVLHSLAIVESGLARSALRVLYGATTPTAEQKDRALGVATRHLLQAGSIWMFWAQRVAKRSGDHGDGEGIGPDGDVVSNTTSTRKKPAATASTTAEGEVDRVSCGALAGLALAEATLCAVRKDDPYPSLVTQERDSSDLEWMYKAPEIPKSRALLDARLCLAAADHAGRAAAGLVKGRDGVERYTVDVKRVCRCRAARFFAMDAEMAGKTGEALAWLRGGKGELLGGKENDSSGSAAPGGSGGGSSSKLKKMKQEWTDRKEGKRVETGGEWGLDGGKGEELRILDMLDSKWARMNDTMNTQPIPASAPFLQSMPQGREIYTLPRYTLPVLDDETLIRMKAPASAEKESGMGVDDDDGSSGEDEDDGYDDGGGYLASTGPVGAFPGTGAAYTPGGGTYY